MLRAFVDPFRYWSRTWRDALDGVSFLASGKALTVLRPAWVAFEAALLIVGLLFWATLSMGVSAFSPETWGEWACILPAKLWAAVQIIASLTIIYGLLEPPKWRLITAGAIIHAVQYQALALSAVLSGGQVVIGVYPSFLFVPAHILLAVEAWRHGRRK